MAENPHYKELLQVLNEFEVEYLIVGGFAVMKYGEPRYTKDLDVWVHNSAQNPLRWSQHSRSSVLLSSMIGSVQKHSPRSRWSIKLVWLRYALIF